MTDELLSPSKCCLRPDFFRAGSGAAMNWIPPAVSFVICGLSAWLLAHLGVPTWQAIAMSVVLGAAIGVGVHKVRS